MLENDIIQSLYPKGKFPKEDCYYLDNKTLITTDSISEGTHFRHDWSSPEQIATKLVEVNVSDIGAGGGGPTKAFLNLGLSKFSRNDSWLIPFINQLKLELETYQIELCGGDTYASKHTNLTLTLHGKIIHKSPRSAGKPHSNIYISGEIGNSLLGYKLLNHEIKAPKLIAANAIQHHLAPRSELALANKIAKFKITEAMMDITDGLVQDLEKMAIASNLKFTIHLDKLPNLKHLLKYLTLDEIITSGEELKLIILTLATFPNSFGCKKIGITDYGKGVEYFYKDKPYRPSSKGFVHF